MTTRPGTAAGTMAGRLPSAGRASGRDLRNERIRVVMRAEPTLVEAGTSLREALARLQGTRSECLLVTEAGFLVGIVTERDVLLKVLGRDVDLGAPVDGLMTSRPDTLTPEDTVGEALALMDRGGYRHVPLVDGAGRPAGVLRQADVIAYLAEAFPEEILNLPPRPHQRMVEADGA
ncbi:MAG: cyclic nucleotide-binding/CBS domain-containing protein [Candidatus Limnocylindrales bacterium]